MTQKRKPSSKRYPGGLRAEVNRVGGAIRPMYAAMMAARGGNAYADIAAERASLVATIAICQEQLAELDVQQDAITTEDWLETAAALIEREGITPKQAVERLSEAVYGPRATPKLKD